MGLFDSSRATAVPSWMLSVHRHCSLVVGHSSRWAFLVAILPFAVQFSTLSSGDGLRHHLSVSCLASLSRPRRCLQATVFVVILASRLASLVQSSALSSPWRFRRATLFGATCIGCQSLIIFFRRWITWRSWNSILVCFRRKCQFALEFSSEYQFIDFSAWSRMICAVTSGKLPEI